MRRPKAPHNVRLRFLQLTASPNPYFPFQPGQVIHLSRLNPEVRQWIRDGRAELIQEVAELAALGVSGETAAMPKGRARGSR
jgi:hypothetical protein